jgi:hypothetical protein
MVERRSSATKASTGERRREINKEYCCPYTQLVLLYALVRNIYQMGTLTKAKRKKAKQVNLTKAKRTKAKRTKSKHKVGSA